MFDRFRDAYLAIAILSVAAAVGLERFAPVSQGMDLLVGLLLILAIAISALSVLTTVRGGQSPR
jgi:hypothetical protein